MTFQLDRFLMESKACVDRSSIDLLVMGNQAADLDSMASALAFACFQAVNGQEGIVPLMPIARADLKLRTETVFVLEQAKINPDHLVFLDDILLPEFLNRVCRLALVDHNRLSPDFEILEEKVDMILDHHQDQGLYPQSVPRVIEPVGSCATLVGDILIRESPELLETGLSILLGSTILLDTVNLDPIAGRVTPKDTAVAHRLLKDFTPDLNQYFKKLQDARFKVSDLTTLDLLRKDYKEFQLRGLMWGISSAPLSIAAWQDKDPDFYRGFHTYAQSRKLDVLISMNAYEDNGFKRELGLYCPDPDVHDTLVSVLKKIDPGLTTLGGMPGFENRIIFFTQADSKMSRKKLVPLLTEAFHG